VKPDYLYMFLWINNIIRKRF